MKLSDLQRIEQAKKKKAAVKAVPQDLPGVRSSGLLRAMTDEERKEFFAKARKDAGLE